MRIIAAYLMAVLAGNNNPDKATILKILDSVGIRADENRVDKLISDLNGKDLNALIAAGNEKMSSFSFGGGGGGGGAAPAASAPADKAGGKPEKEKEKAKEAEKEAEKEESEGDLGFSLFD